mmetsp:Transcript_23510/g.23175  ORF Transcript_23510/g.23175 Transcript_23510/m.23175 type:complete len:92 (+) Transcript_23510:499-774(+)
MQFSHTQGLLFNHFLLGLFLEQPVCDAFIKKAIYGNVAIRDFNDGDKKCQFIIISRRDCRRLGKKLRSRGLHQNGTCSNFAVSEHILLKYG